MVELVDITFVQLVLISVTLALLLENHVQMIELASVILVLLMEVLVGVIFVHAFEHGLT